MKTEKGVFEMRWPAGEADIADCADIDQRRRVSEQEVTVSANTRAGGRWSPPNGGGVSGHRSERLMSGELSITACLPAQKSLMSKDEAR